MTETVIEVSAPVEQVPAPAAPAPARPPAAAARAGLPGIPLALAGVNVVGTAGAGVLTVGGPVALVAVAGTVGAVALGAAARRVTRRTQAKTSRKLREVPGTRKSTTGSIPRPKSSSPSSAGQKRPSGGGLRAAVRGATRRTPTTSTTPHTATGSSARKTPKANTNTARTSTPNTPNKHRPQPPIKAPSKGAANKERTGLGQAVRAAGKRVRQAANDHANKAPQRTEKRLAKGKAKAERQAGLTPATQAKLDPKSLGAAQKKALRRSAVRHRARMAGSALVAGTAGLVSAAWNLKRPGVATRFMRTVWGRLAARARTAREKRDAQILGKPAPGDATVPAETVTDPNRAPARRTYPTFPALRRTLAAALGEVPTIGVPMSDSAIPAFSLSSAAEVMLQAATTFEPEVMEEFQLLVEDLPTAFGTIQDVLRVLSELSKERLRVHPAVIEEIGEGYQAMAKVIEALEEVGTTYRRVHAEDIERTQNPVNGIEAERKWNV